MASSASRLVTPLHVEYPLKDLSFSFIPCCLEGVCWQIRRSIHNLEFRPPDPHAGREGLQGRSQEFSEGISAHG